MANEAQWTTIAKGLSEQTLKGFVNAVNEIVKQIAGTPVGGVSTAPTPVDYAHAEITVGVPPGGWLSVEEFRDASRRMTEAIAAEKWVEGFITAVQIMIMIGGAA